MDDHHADDHTCKPPVFNGMKPTAIDPAIDGTDILAEDQVLSRSVAGDECPEGVSARLR